MHKNKIPKYLKVSLIWGSYPKIRDTGEKLKL